MYVYQFEPSFGVFILIYIISIYYIKKRDNEEEIKYEVWTPDFVTIVKEKNICRSHIEAEKRVVQIIKERIKFLKDELDWRELGIKQYEKEHKEDV